MSWFVGILFKSSSGSPEVVSLKFHARVHQLLLVVIIILVDATTLGRRRRVIVRGLALALLLSIGLISNRLELLRGKVPVFGSSVGVLVLGHLGKHLEVGLSDSNALVSPEGSGDLDMTSSDGMGLQWKIVADLGARCQHGDHGLDDELNLTIGEVVLLDNVVTRHLG